MAALGPLRLLRALSNVGRDLQHRLFPVDEEALLAPLPAAATLEERGKALDRYLAGVRRTPRYERLVSMKDLSMLHWEILAVLRWCVRQTSGAALELGPYLGATTIVMADALTGPGRRVVSVEKGGAHEHPTLSTSDILGDLKKNVERHGVGEAVRIVEGDCGDPAVVARVEQALGGARVDLLLIDADGHVGRDIDNYGRLCAPSCYVLIDDYVSPFAPEKVVLIRESVDRMVAEGRLRALGVYGWGTWVGQLAAGAPRHV